MTDYICNDRNQFSEKLAKEISNDSSAFFYFQGKCGVGKEYVVDKIELLLKQKFLIYRLAADTILKKDKSISIPKSDLSISLNSFIGLSLSQTNNDPSKINYIISILKGLSFKKNIIISAIDYDLLPAESRDFINVLLSNKKIIEDKTKKNITLIITGNHNYFSGKYECKTVIFEDYNRADIYEYLTQTCHYPIIKITQEKLNYIYQLCGTNFNLVACYAKYILEGDIQNNSIEAIIDKKLNYYIQSGYRYNLTEEYLKDILYTSSISINMLTPQMVSCVTDTDINGVDKSFKCAVNECFLNKENTTLSCENFYFISEYEKKYLCNKMADNRFNKMLEYYSYISGVAEDEYFERAQFLFYLYNKINEVVFTMLGLSLSKSYLLNDELTRKKTRDFFEKHNNNYQYNELIKNIDNAYKNHYAANYMETEKILSQFDYSKINFVLAAELRRLQFKNGNLGHLFSAQKMNGLVNILMAYLEKGIILNANFPCNLKEEKLLSLRIIFDVAPYVLDTQNEKESFRKLYDKSLLLVKYINQNFIKKSFAEYIVNIFNRKAFLFAPPMKALLYYEQAEAYFRDNNILEEYIVTLASKAGNSIALHNYTAAIKDCNKAIDLIKENNIQIQQIEKIYNNLYIAMFLEYESKTKSINQSRKYAKTTISSLEKLLTNEPCGRNHVILTNISSLYLYTNAEKQYLKTKKRIEQSLKCVDVSDINDMKVNDFYRYHFAWYEFFRNLHNEDWIKCEQIIKNLADFYPSIFHNTEKMNLRVEAARALLDAKYIPPTLQYCLNFLQYAPSNKNFYTSRGLLLSDLQFTSWE